MEGTFHFQASLVQLLRIPKAAVHKVVNSCLRTSEAFCKQVLSFKPVQKAPVISRLPTQLPLRVEYASLLPFLATLDTSQARPAGASGYKPALQSPF